MVVRQATNRLLLGAEPAPAAEGAGEAAAEGDAAPEAAPPVEDAQEGEEEGGPPKPDYSKNMLEYVVASSGQVSLPGEPFMCQRSYGMSVTNSAHSDSLKHCPTVFRPQWLCCNLFTHVITSQNEPKNFLQHVVCAAGP